MIELTGEPEAAGPSARARPRAAAPRGRAGPRTRARRRTSGRRARAGPARSRGADDRPRSAPATRNQERRDEHVAARRSSRSGTCPAGARTGPRDARSSLMRRGYPTRRIERAASAARCRWPHLGSAHEHVRTLPAEPPRPSSRSTPVDGVDVLGALSPSRAGDFMTCPLLYRFRTIDRLPEEPSPDAVRGTVVHKVLEDLFDLPAAERTPEQAARPAGARVGAAARGRARARRDVHRRGPRGRGVAGLVPGRARPLLHARGPAPPRAGRARAVRRGAARLQAAAARLRRPPRRRARRRDPGGRLQDRPVARRDVRGQGAVPDEVLRAGHLAHPRRRARRCCSWSTSATARCCATSPTRPTCSPPSARSRRSGGRSARAEETGDWRPSRSRCATGAPTRRSAPRSAAPRRRCPTAPATAASSTAEDLDVAVTAP